MAIPPHLCRFKSDPVHLTTISPVLHPDKNPKKEFPSVAKLLDDLNFRDETHPDFLIRSSRFKSKSNPLAHRSLFMDHSTICVHSSFKAKPSLLAPRANRLDQPINPNQFPIPSPRLDPTIPLLRSSSEPNSGAPFSVPSPTGSELSSASSSSTLKESRKRPYASEEDDEHDSSDSDETGNSALGLRINWKSQINQSKSDCDRVTVRPSRTWLKRPVGEPTEGCLVEAKEAGNQLVGLIVPESFDIHQADKRRRFIHSPRFHQVIR